MIYKLIEQFSSIIDKYEIIKFHHIHTSYALILQITFKDQSQLFARDYLFQDGTRKYSFHFQDKKNNLIFRYDNAPHWPDVPTFPHHMHQNNEILPSKPVTLETVLYKIENYFSSE